MINLRARSERWPLRPLTRTLFTWEAGKDCNARTLRRAMESTNLRTREERGRTWDCETRSRSRVRSQEFASDLCRSLGRARRALGSAERDIDYDRGKWAV